MKLTWEKYGSKKIAESNQYLIDKIENLAKLSLPTDYKDFFNNYSGFECFIGAEYVVIWEPKEVLQYNCDYQIFKNLDQTLAIGSNGSDELIAIEELDDLKARIILTPIILEKKAHINIGDSFHDFINRLENNINWFS